MLNASLTNALILLKGKPEPGGISPPETGFFISEQNPDDSITDQISVIYSHLNNLILAINHNASMLNGVSNSVKATIDGRQIIGSLRQLDNLSEETEVDRCLKPLKQRLVDLSKTFEDQTAKVSGVEEALHKTELKITEIEVSKATFSSIDSKVTESENRNTRKNTDLERKLFDKISEIKSKSDDSVANMVEKVTRVEKDLAWKINDYGDLLKLRPTEASIQTNISNLEQKIRAELEEIIGKKLAEQRLTQGHSTADSTFNRSLPSFNDLYEKIHHFENQ